MPSCLLLYFFTARALRSCVSCMPPDPSNHGARHPTVAPFAVFRGQNIRFEGSQEEFQLVVEASSAPVAVFPAEALTDLRCCVFGKLYLKKVRHDAPFRLDNPAPAREPKRGFH